MAKTVRQKNPVSKPPTPKKENNEPYIIPQTRYNFSVLIIFKIPLRLLCLYDESYQIFKKKIILYKLSYKTYNIGKHFNYFMRSEYIDLYV